MVKASEFPISKAGAPDVLSTRTKGWCYQNSVFAESAFGGDAASAKLAALFGLIVMEELDISNWQGIEQTRHLTRSAISIDTLLMSQGKIPIALLRGCGLPSLLIDYLPCCDSIPFLIYQLQHSRSAIR